MSQKHMWMHNIKWLYLLQIPKFCFKKTSCVYMWEKLLQRALMFFSYLHAWGDPVITVIADGIISRAKGFSGCCKLTSGILFFRVYPYLCRAVRNFARDHGNVPLNKEFYVALEDLPTRHK